LYRAECGRWYQHFSVIVRTGPVTSNKVKTPPISVAVAVSLILLWVLPATVLAQFFPGGSWRVTAPPPTGANRVGTLSLYLVDSVRNDPYQAGRQRELMVRFWYPAITGRACIPADYTSTQIWAYTSRLSGFPLPAVRTNSCQGAAISEGSHPVILFTHGYTGFLTDATFLFEELASHGYVVASIAHTSETTAVEFPGGRLVTSVFGSYLDGESLRMDYQSLRRAHAVRMADLRFVIDQLSALNGREGSPFVGSLDLSRIAVMGHSLGGEVAIAMLESHPKMRAAVSLDGVVSAELAPGTSKPVLLLAASRGHWNPEECKLWAALRGPRTAINFRGADHFTLSDAVWLLPDVPELGAPVGRMGRERTLEALRNYILAFFDTHLGGKPEPGLLDGKTASSRFPDASVIGPTQELCPLNFASSTGAIR